MYCQRDLNVTSFAFQTVFDQKNGKPTYIILEPYVHIILQVHIMCDPRVHVLER